jgi:hypothetical protein
MTKGKDVQLRKDEKPENQLLLSVIAVSAMPAVDAAPSLTVGFPPSWLNVAQDASPMAFS